MYCGIRACKSRAQHGGQAPSSRPGAVALFWKPSFTRPRLSHAHWTTGWPLHPCLLKSLAPPTTIFFPGPHNFISSFQRNAVNACVLAAPRLPTRRALSARLRQPPVLELAARQCLDKPKQPTHQDLYHRSVITPVPCLRLLLVLLLAAAAAACWSLLSRCRLVACHELMWLLFFRLLFLVVAAAVRAQSICRASPAPQNLAQHLVQISSQPCFHPFPPLRGSHPRYPSLPTSFWILGLGQ